MAFTAAVFTSLAVWGGPGPVSAPLEEASSATDTASVSVSEAVQTDVLLTSSGDSASVSITESGAVLTLEASLTDLLPWTAPGGYRDIGDKSLADIQDVDVTDTASVSGTDTATAAQLAEVEVSDDASVTATEGTPTLLQYEGSTTDLAVYGLPGTYRDIGDKPVDELVDFNVFDGGSVTATEDPVDAQLVSTTDTISASASEAPPVILVSVDAFDTGPISLTEGASLSITGSIDVNVTDTTSASLAESAAIFAQSDVSDAASVTGTDEATLDIDVEPTLVTVDVSDTASVSGADTADEVLVDPAFIVASDDIATSISEIFVLDTFDGQVALSVSDVAVAAVQEVAQRTITDGRPGYLKGTVRIVPALVGVATVYPVEH